MNRCIAADIGGTKTAAALVADGVVVERREQATPAHDPSAIVAQLAANIADWLDQTEILAVAATGVYRDGHIYAVNRNTLDRWDGFPIVDALAARLPENTRISVMNDAAAAAWAEYRARRETEATLAFITVSTGVGGGLVVGGRLLQGATGLAGHIGHMRVADGPPCGCGRIGCVEAIASGAAIAAGAGALLGTSMNARQVFEQCAGDRRLDDLIATSARAVATLIVNLKMVLDIDIAVLGGSIGLAAGYLDRVVGAATSDGAVAVPVIEPAIAGADAGLLGAADWCTRSNG